MKDVDVKIKWVDKLRGSWAIIHPPTVKKPYYLIKIQKNAPLWEIAGTFMHEMLHLLFYTYFGLNSVNAQKEHVACEAVDEATKIAVKKYLGVREDL